MEDEDSESWYEKPQAAVFKVPPHDMLLITGDTNAKAGYDNTNCEKAMEETRQRSDERGIMEGVLSSSAQ